MTIKKITFIASLLVTLLAGVSIGYAVGAAPLRQSLKLSGGMPGDIATKLGNSASMLSVGNGGAEEVIKKEIRLADSYLILAAQLYCQMDDKYRLVAVRSAKELSENPAMTSDNPLSRDANYYLLHASESKECKNFQVTK